MKFGELGLALALVQWVAAERQRLRTLGDQTGQPQPGIALLDEFEEQHLYDLPWESDT